MTCPTLGTASTPYNLAANGAHNIAEASGTVASGDYVGTLWTHEDSGQPVKVYAHDASNGNLQQVTTLSVTMRDWEDISIMRNASAVDQIVLFDMGDNNYNRTNSALIVFDEQSPTGGNKTITPTTYPFTFKDVNNVTVHPNIEAGVVDPGGQNHIYAFAKDRDSVYGANSSGSGRGDFSVYDCGQFANLSTTANTATYLCSIDGVSAAEWTAGTRTGPVAADISSDRRWLIVKNYQEGLCWERTTGNFSTLITATPDAPCVLATGSGKYEGVAFSSTVDKLYQVRDDTGNGTTPLKIQSVS